ncbi:MAG: CotH kinase family protein [Prevotella sp.]|nr:CotH kinase family protein [Bacteroides sp.]MCM1365804.1 CotH kinase family protein [Prevotella sp.]MCM1436504.1 CotH kinase family protein [Prevotella sp.]
MKLKLPSFCILAAMSLSAVGQLRVNEIMQSNIDGLYFDHEFPDSWVEIKNTSDSPVDLKGWGLGVKDKYSKAYIFPETVIINPGELIVVYCDKEDTGLHTSFRVDSGKSILNLWDPSGNLVETINLAKFPAPEIPYGLKDNGEWSYFLQPTPGMENTSTPATNLLPNPVVSPSAGLYQNPVKVQVSLPVGDNLPEDVMLCVTTDGSEPKRECAVRGKISWESEISESTVVRAKLFSDKWLSPRSVTVSYIFHPRELSLPVVSLSTDPKHLYDEEMGIFAGSEDNPNWKNDWRRPVNVEYFTTDGHEIFSQLGETRIQGGNTRVNPQKSLAIYSNKRFGKKMYDTSDFWKDKPEVVESPSFIIRNAGNDWGGAHIIDGFAQTLLGNGMPDVDYQAYQPAVIYINGKYYGLLNLRERSNDDYVVANYNGNEDIEMFENYEEIKVGDDNIIDNLLDIFDDDSLTVGKLSEQVSISNYSANVAYAIYNCYGDWLGNNTVWWRSVAKNGDSRWRMLTKDLDHTFGRYKELPSKNPFPYLRQWENHEHPYYKRIGNVITFLFKNKEGRSLLASNIAFMAGDFCNPIYAEPFFVRMTDEISDEMKDNYEVNQTPGNAIFYYENWLESISAEASMRTFIRQRPDYIFNILKEEFSLGNIYELSVEHGNAVTSFNNLPFTKPTFNTRFFTGESVKLAGVDKKVWVLDETTEKDGEKHIVYPDGDIEYVASPDVKKAVFSLDDSNSVGELINDVNVVPVYYTLEGLLLDGKPENAGIYIEKRGSKSKKVVVK